MSSKELNLKIIVSALAVGLLMCVLSVSSCRKHNADIVKFEFANSSESLKNLIESVEYIPLETDTSLVLDGEPELYLGDSDFYVVNKREHLILISPQRISEACKRNRFLVSG